MLSKFPQRVYLCQGKGNVLVVIEKWSIIVPVFSTCKFCSRSSSSENLLTCDKSSFVDFCPPARLKKGLLPLAQGTEYGVDGDLVITTYTVVCCLLEATSAVHTISQTKTALLDFLPHTTEDLQKRI